MDLAAALASISSVADLPGLVSALGHQPLWDQAPPGKWTHGIGADSPVMVIGRTGTLPWLAIRSRSPERSANRLASHLIRRGRLSMVLALDSETRRLAVRVTLGKSPGVVLDLARPNPEGMASLARLGGMAGGGSLAFAIQAADALSAESVGRRFFQEFQATLERMATGLPGPMQPEDRHGLALLQLTRVLFLYFIQTKGWLGGRERFLAEEVDRCLAHRRRLHRDLLRPLFFGTLNQPRELRSRTAAAFGTIPFLNGGLFEPHQLERRFGADIPNDLWRDAFDRLFERFHFTVAEGSRAVGGVGPDMLGRVFEGVMAPEARRASGTFYTPAALVDALLEAALTATVARALNCGEAEAQGRMQDGDARVGRVLRRLTVLDPAVGSGAFLLGALERLAAGLRNRSARRRVLAQNLFGVDQSAAAVRLTELRLWLAVIADDPADCIDAVSPLPNLDCLIRQGDSLFDPFGCTGSLSQRAPELVREQTALRHQFVNATGPDKRSLLRRLKVVESKVLSQSLVAAEELHRIRIGECLSQARSNDLFGHRGGLNRESCTTLKELRAGLRQVRLARKRLAQEGEAPWFHYQSHFADVFAAGGFDIVIGNPPWLRSEQISPPLRRRLIGRYRWWRAIGTGYSNHPDLSVAFLERGLELVRPSGVVAMLLPAKITSAGYGAVARHALASTTTLHAVADLTQSSLADFDATVYPLAIVAGKSAAPERHRVRTTLLPGGEIGILQSELRGGGSWLLLPNRVRDLVAELDQSYPKLGERVVCHLGVKTGANEIFLDPPTNLEPEVLRWAARGRDLTPFRCQPKIRLLWTHDRAGRPRLELPPAAAAHLKPHHSQLRARKDFRDGPPWQLFRVGPAIALYRVVWADLARSLTAVALTTEPDLELIPLNTCYLAPVPSGELADRLAAWLNSTWLRTLAWVGAVPAANGFARFNAQTVSRLPLPDSVLTDSKLTRLAQAGREGAPVQAELDQIAALQLGLSTSDQSALREVRGAAPDRR